MTNQTVLLTILATLAMTVPAAAEEADAGPRLGAYAEVDAGLLAVMRQSGSLAGGVSYGPFRGGLSYATFLSNAAFGGTPDGFSLRVNHLIGVNAAYFIAQDTDEGAYVQGMVHIKEQGVSNLDDGAHADLFSLAVGLEVGYVWKFYKGAYVAPRVGALYYVDKPQPGNAPVQIGNRAYDNGRHKDWDTYFIPTLSVGYAW